MVLAAPRGAPSPRGAQRRLTPPPLLSSVPEGLKTPSNCELVVGGEPQCWAEGRCLLFDDSFLHTAFHEGKRRARLARQQPRGSHVGACPVPLAQLTCSPLLPSGRKASRPPAPRSPAPRTLLPDPQGWLCRPSCPRLSVGAPGASPHRVPAPLAFPPASPHLPSSVQPKPFGSCSTGQGEFVLPEASTAARSRVRLVLLPLAVTRGAVLLQLSRISRH